MQYAGNSFDNDLSKLFWKQNLYLVAKVGKINKCYDIKYYKMILVFLYRAMLCSQVMEAAIFDLNLLCMESITLRSTSLQRAILRCSTFPHDILSQVSVAW